MNEATQHARRSEPKPHGTEGFSLIEMMAVVAIVGILSAVALPELGIHVAKSKRVEAELALTDLDKLQRVHYHTHHRYASNIRELGFKLDRGEYLSDTVYKGKYYRYSTKLLDKNGQSYVGFAVGSIDFDEFEDVLFVRRADKPGEMK
jgi:prepilin-type N-terminal cleavage/methylation domain-containing protein